MKWEPPWKNKSFNACLESFNLTVDGVSFDILPGFGLWKNLLLHYQNKEVYMGVALGTRWVLYVISHLEMFYFLKNNELFYFDQKQIIIDFWINLR